MRIIGITLLLALFCSCQKNRTCECKNGFSTYDAGEVKATKASAKKTCKALSSADTECYLKD